MHGTIDHAGDDHLREAREKAYAMPLADFDPGNPELFRTDTHWPYFDRLRKEEPVHYCKDSMFGPYWSVTKYNDIMAVDTNHGAFSSAASLGGITIRDVPPELRRESFICHGPAAAFGAAQDRGAVVHAREPRRTRHQHPSTRRRLSRQFAKERGVRFRRHGLDRTDDADAGGAVRFPLGRPPQADALVRCGNDIAGTGGLVATEDDRQKELLECATYFARLWNERIKAPPKADLLSMMAHNEATRDMDPKNFLGNLILLIVGGNDTTRNTMSGSLYALHKHPDQYKKLRENPALLDTFVPEVIRWQTPLAHMRRTALQISSSAASRSRRATRS